MDLQNEWQFRVLSAISHEMAGVLDVILLISCDLFAIAMHSIPDPLLLPRQAIFGVIRTCRVIRHKARSFMRQRSNCTKTDSNLKSIWRRLYYMGPRHFVVRFAWPTAEAVVCGPGAANIIFGRKLGSTGSEAMRRQKVQ
jgi:hypothetical protein